MNKKPLIAVIGGSVVTSEIYDKAYQVGKIIAQNGCILLCGGKGGIMEASAKGAKEYNGLTIGILPENSKTSANEYIDIPIMTGFGEARNVIIAHTCDLAIAIDGKYGTLSEIAFCLINNKTVLGIDTHNIDGVIHLTKVEDIVPYMRKLCK